MAELSDARANDIIDWLFGGATPTRPTGRKLALYTDATTEVSTADWTNYAATAITSAAASSRATSNSGAVDFGTATTTGDVTCTHWAVLDQANNPIWGPKAFPESVIVQNGNPVSVPIGDLDISFPA